MIYYYLLFDKRNTWIKKWRDLFDVAMATCKGVEVRKNLIKKSTKFAVNMKLYYKGMTAYQFLETKVVYNWNIQRLRLRNQSIVHT